jgi:hypothetical protein
LAALIIAAICTLAGGVLLASGHFHRERESIGFDLPQRRSIPITGTILLLLAMAVSLGWAIRRFVQKSHAVPQEEKHIVQPAPSSPPKVETAKVAGPQRPPGEASLELTHTAAVLHASENSVFVAGSPVQVDVVYENTRGGTAREVIADCMVVIFSGSLPGEAGVRAEETEKWDGFRKGWLSRVASGRATDNDIAGYDKTHFCEGRTHFPLDQREAQRLRDEIDVIYVFGAVKWDDGSGQYESQICSRFMPKEITPFPNAPAQWRACLTGHNVIRRPFKLPH